MLATIETIQKIWTHPNADRLELANVRGWQTVVKRGEFKEGDKIVFVQIDTILPKAPWSEFLIDKDRPDRRIRLRTVKLRGEVSQGLILPLSVLSSSFDEGAEVSEILGITKYEKEEPGGPGMIGGQARSNFPSHLIPRTDEERIQNFPDVIAELQNELVYASVKIDGTSATYVQDGDGSFHACSRNISKKEDDIGIYWKMAKCYDLVELLKKCPTLALQGEIAGPGIQKNPLGLSEIDLFIFNAYDTSEHRYLGYEDLFRVCKENNLRMVPVLEMTKFKWQIIPELLEYARGTYEGTKMPREGIVIRPVVDRFSVAMKGRCSFKVINPDYND